MKKYLNLSISCFTALALLSSCEDGDKPFDEIFANTGRGAVLRTIDQEGSFFDRNDTSTSWSVVFEAQDPEDGALLEKVDFFVGFDDNTDDEDAPRFNGVQDPAEVLVETVPASAFTIGEFGFPRASVDSSFEEALTALGLVPGEYDGGDRILFRLELTLTDGRVFSNADNTGTIEGSFFASPFLYPLTIKCVPTAPVPGDYTIEINDSFGDGWDGAFITVTQDGTEVEYTITEGDTGTFTFTVPDGTTQLDFEYTPGNFEGEHTYNITGPTGELAVEDGPNPTPGEIILSICI
ncbi:MAG: hypothetical protein AAGF77_05105 [Bacteroidota bacterium]